MIVFNESLDISSEVERIPLKIEIFLNYIESSENQRVYYTLKTQIPCILCITQDLVKTEDFLCVTINVLKTIKFPLCYYESLETRELSLCYHESLENQRIYFELTSDCLKTSQFL